MRSRSARAHRRDARNFRRCSPDDVRKTVLQLLLLLVVVVVVVVVVVIVVVVEDFVKAPPCDGDRGGGRDRDEEGEV